jgi:Spy/CpxP family protein refolding chaperone
MEMITMFRSTTDFENRKPLAVVARPLSFRLASGLLAVASILTVVPANAQGPAGGVAKVAAQAAVAPVAKATAAHADAIPEHLETLNLTADQQAKIKAIIQSYNGSIGVAWKQFGERYMQTIAIESSLLAAVEDNLTEAQRQQVRDQRSKTAKHAGEHAAPAEHAAAKDEKGARHAAGAEAEIAAAGVTLTHEQQAAAEEIHENYRAQLRTMHREIHGLHNRLLSLEADKLVQIEKVLTEAQLAQLRTSRQNAHHGVKAAVSKK